MAGSDEEANKRIEQLRASLSPEGRAFLEKLEDDLGRRGAYAEENQMAGQARFIQQLNTLSAHDHGIVVEVLRLWALSYFDPEERTQA
jgi:hypothetical protein